MAPRKAGTWISLCNCACFALGALVSLLSVSPALASTFKSPSPRPYLAQESTAGNPEGSAASIDQTRSLAPATNATLPGADQPATALSDSEPITSKPKPTLLEEVLANPLLVASIMFAVLYLGVLLPAQRSTKRAQREQEEQIANLKKNDRVVTSFGVHGVVVSTQPDAKTVTIRIDESSNAKLTVNRDTIRVVKKD
jgi:preprotein translocase YajC subunit